MRVMVLGAAGMLGHKVLQHFIAAGYDTLGTVRDDAGSRLARVPLFASDRIIWGVDAMDWFGLRDVLRAHRPAVVINALGIIKQRALAHAPTPSIQINALLPHLVAEVLAEWNGRLIHVSSDCVFDGTKGHYRETDRSDAEDLYGRSKFMGEVTDVPHAVTLRSSIIGRELRHHQSLFDWFLAQRGGRVQGFRRVIYSGSTTNEMARVIEMVVRDYPTLRGLYHVTTDAIAKHDLLVLLAKAYRMPVDILPADLPISDRSLCGDRFRDATGYVAPAWPDLAAALAADPTPYDDWLALLQPTDTES